MRSCLYSLLLFLPLTFNAQNSQPRFDLPPEVAPASCGMRLAVLGNVTGPPGYLRLAYQLKALQTAQESRSALQDAMAGLQKGRTPALAMSALFTGTKQAHDDLLCSVSIIAKYAPVDENDSNARTLLIVAYNQEAAAIADLEAHTKEQFLRTDTEMTPATQVKDAERMTAISSLQSEAASTLAQMTSFWLLLSVDVSNPHAKDTKQTVIPCALYPSLLKESTELANQPQSAYTDVASFFVKFLGGHRCK